MVVGREDEIAIMENLLKNKRSQFLALYGRRRIGKTFLIDQVYKKNMVFAMSGLQNATQDEQLENFTIKFNSQTKRKVAKPETWLQAFALLTQYVEKSSRKKKVIFFDELPWLSTSKGGFLSALDNFWNSWASKRTDIVLVVCGSAASWMINNIVHNKGGLYNRITQTIRLLPFTLKETEALLKKNNIELTQYQITQLYMVTGGVPHYLMAVPKGKSVEQIINYLCFKKDSLLVKEFEELSKSLFDDSAKHRQILVALATKNMGLTRKELLNLTKLPNAGSTNRIIEELEESGFINKYMPFANKSRDTLYKLQDFYTMFYLKFISKYKNNAEAYLQITKTPQYKAWQGVCFENICWQHIGNIKKALGIEKVNTTQSSWLKRGIGRDKGTQIDLLIDRADGLINICEIKFYEATFEITKNYAEQLRNRKYIFKEAVKTKKAVHNIFITTYGVKKNEYANEQMQDEVLLKNLFK